jgi:glycosyltransferase involved in cell wall biosynthesis
MRRGLTAARTRGWAPATRLFVVGDGSSWSIDDDAQQVAAIATRNGYEVAPPAWAPYARRQAVFLPSHFSALRPRWLGSTHRLGLAYFHGRPGTPGHPEFDETLEILRRNAGRVDRIQVTHAEMHELMLSAGVAEERVFRIPIGIDIERFPLVDAESRVAARQAFGLEDGAFVVGSFQKDGVGWEDGFVAKLVKGPDVLVAALARIHERVPDLVVLLTGRARGDVRAELERRGIPYRHVHVQARDGLARAYHALDAYLVPSNQEGGPKSALESLATGIPLVSTRVGQVPELVVDGRDALLADAGDSEALAGHVLKLREDAALVSLLRAHGRATAEAHTYAALDARWSDLLEGFVERAR